MKYFSIPMDNSYCFVYGHSSTSFFGHSITLVFGIHISLREITTGEIKMGSIHGDQLGEKHIIYLWKNNNNPSMCLSLYTLKHA